MHPYWYNASLGYVDSSSDVSRTACLIGDDSWIGANALILPGCSRIGVGAVIGAGAVLTADVPDFALVVGVPARVVKYRFDARVRSRILDSRYWVLEPEDAQRALDALTVECGLRGEGG
ncbi:hypothetical protein M4D77_07450 [Gordonia sp. p3-SID1431]|nr:hypothetical protein [Gordonia sp. p3-SID1431]